MWVMEMTNEAKIREKISTFKGMADFLSSIWSKGSCLDCPVRKICAESSGEEPIPCNESIRIWLAQRAEE
jgi:hypothetical protein